LEKFDLSDKLAFMHTKTTLLTAWGILAVFYFSGGLQAVEKPTDPGNKPVLMLTEAVMCEAIESYAPKTPAVVFSIDIGKVSCYSSFDPVPEKTHIYHRWYFKDRLTTRKRLFLKPPRWATYTSIQLREADRGPWRVEITDKDGNIFKTLRFSITD
jgi:hypothetical protein